MDNERFDALAEGLATGRISRRQGLKALVGGVAAALIGPFRSSSLGAGPAGAQVTGGVVCRANAERMRACLQAARAAHSRAMEPCDEILGECPSDTPGFVACTAVYQVCINNANSNLRSAIESCEAQFRIVCTPNESCCPGGCTNTQSDPANCGACGNTCPAGFSCCSGDCVNLQVSSFNCGACGRECPAGESCCSGDCSNLLTDSNNCGGCGNVCPQGTTCANGECVGCNPPCPDGQTCCSDNVCVDTDTDRNNCGACGIVCPSGQVCADGRCSDCDPPCPVGQTCCSGVCRNTQSDDNHCGSCGNACPPGQSCNGGTCSGCPEGFELCNDVCIDVLSDPHNCGFCGEDCTTQPFYCGVCQNGTCRCVDRSQPDGCGPCGG